MLTHHTLIPVSLAPMQGDTYFPAVDSFHRPSFSSVLRRLAHVWATHEDSGTHTGTRLFVRNSVDEQLTMPLPTSLFFSLFVVREQATAINDNITAAIAHKRESDVGDDAADSIGLSKRCFARLSQGYDRRVGLPSHSPSFPSSTCWVAVLILYC